MNIKHCIPVFTCGFVAREFSSEGHLQRPAEVWANKYLLKEMLIDKWIKWKDRCYKAKVREPNFKPTMMVPYSDHILKSGNLTWKCKWRKHNYVHTNSNFLPVLRKESFPEWYRPKSRMHWCERKSWCDYITVVIQTFAWNCGLKTKRKIMDCTCQLFSLQL